MKQYNWEQDQITHMKVNFRYHNVMDNNGVHMK
jgi:hypothetical protein